MKLRLVHAVASGVLLALALGFLFVPSLTPMASTRTEADRTVPMTPQLSRAENETAEGYKGAVPTAVVSETVSAMAVSGLSPGTALALSIIAVALVLLSFLLVGRFEERVPKTS